jgi:oligoendopeptidase F
MNFDRTIRSVYTIAHELGHSLNSYYINKKQKIYHEVAIFYAEVASIVNEMLLSYYLLAKYKDNADLNKLILNETIDNFFSTVTRQIIFSHTEFELNKLINQSQPFTKENIKQIYRQMIEKYQGIDKEAQKNMQTEPYSYALSTILRIPHFYAGNFYVYKYAIGQIVAILVADQIYHDDKDMIKKYYDFLSSGSSRSPVETIKLLGIDLYASETYQRARTILDG